MKNNKSIVMIVEADGNSQRSVPFPDCLVFLFMRNSVVLG